VGSTVPFFSGLQENEKTRITNPNIIGSLFDMFILSF
jgi:hypothetical protein